MAFQQGLSGLNAASRNLDVIGNNIANANTVGMKTSRAEFAELYAASLGSSGGSGVGLGVAVDAVSQQFTQGSISITGNNLDVAINGGGFFQLQQPDGTAAYTRAGNFKLDKTGDVVTNAGANVMGYKIDAATGTTIGSSAPVPLSFPTGAPIDAKQTVGITAAFNLDARTPDAASTVPPTPRSTYGTSINVYDSQGVATPVNLYFVKTSTANTWDVFDQLDNPTAVPPVVATAVGQVTFDGNGKLPTTPPPTPITITVDPASANPNNPPAPFPVTLDLSKATQFGNKFSVSDLTQDGYASGELTGIRIANDGMVMASYSNGVSRAEAQVALANFKNPQGLAPGGGNLWTETNASGNAVMGKPGAGPLGMLRAGALEDSNVDLTSELVNMMTAQRAYQANAQTIKTQDQVMSTLVNLR